MAAQPVTALLDTDVLIEVLRQRPAAKTWLQTNAKLKIAIHGVAAMEIINGSENKNDMHRNQTFLSRFYIVWPTSTEFEYAYHLLAQYHLATRIGIPDCLIAATAMERNWQLYSFNLKYYRHISGLNVKAPYQRK
jgi:predicted nucleic acid-binding protein